MTERAFGPWHPGIESAVPRRLLPLATLYRSENVLGSLEDALELADLTGLPAEELVAFRPRRLALHELQVRVMADLSVPDGPRVEDLGINFRAMTSAILARHVEPRMKKSRRPIIGSSARSRRSRSPSSRPPSPRARLPTGKGARPASATRRRAPRCAR